ncbi:hypothetical protein [Chitinophaga lutea]|nr:hypothetical protein [Chitinophaga lutea]
MKKIKVVESHNGISIQQSSGITAKRLATDPAFERTRRHNEEFGRAGKAAILFCDANRMLMAPTLTKGAYNRLQAVFAEVIKGDPVHNRGDRTVALGDTGQLKGFCCNDGVRLKSAIHVKLSPAIDRASGTLKLDIPEIVPIRHIVPPRAASYMRFVICAAEIDFGKDDFNSTYAYSEYIPLRPGENPVAPISLVANVPPASVHPLFLTFGLEFCEKINTFMNDVRHKALNVIEVVAVSARP